MFLNLFQILPLDIFFFSIPASYPNLSLATTEEFFLPQDGCNYFCRCDEPQTTRYKVKSTSFIAFFKKNAYTYVSSLIELNLKHKYRQAINPFTPELKKCILPAFQKAIVWVM